MRAQRGTCAPRHSMAARLAVLSLAAATLLPGTAAAAPPSPSLGTAARPVVETTRLPRRPGLIPETAGRCRGLYRIAGTQLCSHGPDAARPSRRTPGSADLLRGGTATPPAVPGGVAMATETEPPARCDGDGVSGRRVEAIYARPATGEDRYAALVPSIRGWIARIDDAVAASAAEVGGWRRLRWALDAGCRSAVAHVVLSDATIDDFAAMVAELRAQGFARSDRKYHVWYDSGRSPFCGLGSIEVDDSPGAANRSETTVGYGRTDRACWGGHTELHEILHTLGAVQDSAPHSSARSGGRFHCTDENDVMCYPDASGVVMTNPCPNRSDLLLDCGHDDYFHPRPAPDSYLGTHRNLADSGWMIGATGGCIAESLHPYPANADLRWDLLDPDLRAASSRAHLARLDLGPGDRLDVLDGTGARIETLEGTRTDVWTAEVPGRTITLRLVSDGTGEAYGFCADAVETVDPVLYPRAPTDAYGEPVDETRIRLYWTDRSDDEDGFEVRRSDGERFVAVGSTAPDAQGWLDEGLAAGTGYEYRVCAINEHGEDCTPSFWSATYARCATESPHPYPARARLSWTLVNPDPSAASTVVDFRRLETQAGRDFVELRDESGDLIQRIDGVHRDLTSWPVPGRTVHVTLLSDAEIQGWGFCVAGLWTERDIVPKWASEQRIAATAPGAAPGGLVAVGRARAVAVAVQGEPARVVARRTSDSGASWSTPSVLSGSAPVARSPGALDLASYGGAADVLWLEGTGCGTGGTCGARYRTAPDRGTWSAHRTLSASDVRPAAVAVARGPSGRVIAGWSVRSGTGAQVRHDLHVRVSADGGSTFGAPMKVAGWLGEARDAFDLGAGSGALYVTWAQAGEVWVRRSTDDGRTWRTPVRLSANRFIAGGPPRVAASSSGALIGYAVHVSGSTRSVVRASADRGATWVPYVTLARTGGSAPVLARRDGMWWASYARCLADGRTVLYERDSPDGVWWYPPTIVAQRRSAACVPGDPARSTDLLQPLALDVAGSVLVLYRAGTCGSGSCTSAPVVRRGVW